jgi:predicted nucleic acid-binding protein
MPWRVRVQASRYIALETELDALRILRNDRAVAAMSTIGELAEHNDGYHRAPLTDALIAAAAAEQDSVAVLHRDTPGLSHAGNAI